MEEWRRVQLYTNIVPSLVLFFFPSSFSVSTDRHSFSCNIHRLTSVHAHLDRTGLESIVFAETSAVILSSWNHTERVNCMNDSREFQNIDSICSGKISHVPSQPAVVPSLRPMLSRDRSMPPDTLNLSGTQWNVFGIPRHMLDSSQMPHQGILHSTNQSATGGIPVQRSTVRPVARGEERIGSTIPMPMFAGRPSTMNSFLPADIPQNLMAVKQRLQTSELQFDKFTTHSTCSCRKIRFKIQVSSCSDFPSEAML